MDKGSIFPKKKGKKSSLFSLIVAAYNYEQSMKFVCVIVSHMHYDHIGNLEHFKDIAEFFISRNELHHAFTSVCTSSNVEDHGFYIRSEVLADFKKIHIVDEDMELFKGIEAVMLPGHTPGVMGIVLHLDSGTVILPSDAVYGKANYNGTPPGIIEDTLGFQKSLAKVKALAKKYDAQVWFSHDDNLFGKLKKAPEHYR
jgi:glyoxylase-like metal-dependent hydrolase (beta-lactamase superfamily II)